MSMTKEQFEEKVYEAYKLDWMISHGYTLKDYLDALINEDENARANGDYPEGDSRDIFESLDSTFEYETGFGSGSIWACKDEFLGAKLQDEYYMNHLLNSMPNSKELLSFYVKEYHKCIPAALEIPTSAGVLKAYETTIDPGQPGIAVVLQPAGYECEIDMSYVSVYEDEEYVPQGETIRPVDVAIMTYADVYDEDYTSKDIIKREDVIGALSN